MELSMAQSPKPTKKRDVKQCSELCLEKICQFQPEWQFNDNFNSAFHPSKATMFRPYLHGGPGLRRLCLLAPRWECWCPDRLGEPPNADGVDGRDPAKGLLRCTDTSEEGRDKSLSSEENYEWNMINVCWDDWVTHTSNGSGIFSLAILNKAMLRISTSPIGAFASQSSMLRAGGWGNSRTETARRWTPRFDIVQLCLVSKDVSCHCKCNMHQWLSHKVSQSYGARPQTHQACWEAFLFSCKEWCHPKLGEQVLLFLVI